ncbi:MULTISPECIES: carbamoyltransferase HypF [Aphanizomenon]|uniref:Carbamoyltransferase n=2 Tax=Aphanizomenon flos-aquae TaxID=1176 RepID=A0ABR8IMC1_APHFL|nr:MULTISPECIES: carbamoyltransferase HypF [Aphanizomenon]MBD2389676.1 carbamoyltransferase HypF [Aphanizomenon flos-aquae FACHB-1171]MBD2557218.1 carbamoyltransferase HypF [Aphanizomenon flos-aquae FACHB-1290]MBD2630632.1 carbamoyltransferase HypF [Aphanizomenon sp. FACHB-1399]MBD2641539.1 carbamoyltransferase HypF [Aphanizomenon sp. FACHB-1401]MBD2656845.1 carbamoyltransferase HypF [Aphanizomenon flos-aquae FACHB-1265]
MRIEEIRVCGIVQGVGFRPTVYRLAKVFGLKGEVYNDGKGVLIRVSGSEEIITDFVNKLYQECPPLARINQVVRGLYWGEFNFDNFVISPSINGVIKTQVSPDAASCPQCQREIFDPFSRYFRYPFTNCTHCGPRLTIIRAIPYDRDNTSMANFPMCKECEREYEDVENRRFHAQPVACFVCGPRAWLERADGKPMISDMFSMLDDLDAVCTLLQKGEIIAIKGLGGFNLACDATLQNAVQKLRNRKYRYHKPLALMARDINIISEYCYINDLEKQLLTSSAAPIVLLKIKDNSKLASDLAPGQNTLGFMLPYTPLHHLILRRMKVPIVLTSANISNEPQCINNEDAKDKLSKIADYFLLHNRDIVNRVDDSVVRVIDNKIQTLRRARGYAPAPIILPPGFEKIPPILAMGSELKNTFCLLREGEAILSQHLGDLENASAFNAYQETLNLYLNLFEHQPEIIAIDKHPEYLSSKLGKQLATVNHIKLAEIQHHHAHIAACMAENQISLDTKPILGIAFDGLGYGEDGTLWGGEFLLADYQSFQRLATFKPMPMIGGKQAIYQPWRNTYSQLINAFSWEEIQEKYRDLAIIKFLENKNPKLLNQIIKKGINSPLTSSVGRLFDAVAAAIGICPEQCSYEGQAAIEMEAIADTNILNNDKETLNYSFKLEKSANIYYIDTSSTWREILDDIKQHISSSEIAAKFHQSLAITTVKIVKQLKQENQFNQVVLTGGVFQNQILLQQVKMRLEKLEINVLTHSIVPTNDGGLSLGQSVIAAAKYLKERL